MKKMSGCKMRGFFTIDGRRGKKPNEETYTIARIEKLNTPKLVNVDGNPGIASYPT